LTGEESRASGAVLAGAVLVLAGSYSAEDAWAELLRSCPLPAPNPAKVRAWDRFPGPFSKSGATGPTSLTVLDCLAGLEAAMERGWLGNWGSFDMDAWSLLRKKLDASWLIPGEVLAMANPKGTSMNPRFPGLLCPSPQSSEELPPAATLTPAAVSAASSAPSAMALPASQVSPAAPSPSSSSVGSRVSGQSRIGRLPRPPPLPDLSRQSPPPSGNPSPASSPSGSPHHRPSSFRLRGEGLLEGHSPLSPVSLTTSQCCMEEWDFATPGDYFLHDDSCEGEIFRDFPASPDAVARAPSLLQSRAREAESASSNESANLERENFVDYLLRKHVAVVARLNHDFECPQQKDYIRIFEQAGFAMEACMFADGGTPTKAILRSFLRIMRRTREQGMCIAVHCMGGLGRTGVIVGAYAVSHHGLSGKAFHGWTRMCRPGTVQTTKQEAFLRALKPGSRSRGNSLNNSLARLLSTISAGSSHASSSRGKLEDASGHHPAVSSTHSGGGDLEPSEYPEKSREGALGEFEDFAPWNVNRIIELEGMKVITVGGGVADI